MRKLLDVAANLSKDDLLEFRSVAVREYPSVVPLIEEYLHLADRASTSVPVNAGLNSSRRSRNAAPHLFDMLRDKRAFPANSDLSDFAGRILPDMTRRRFEKMSRGEIAAKITEYVEGLDPRRRQELEASMRDSMIPGVNKPADRKSFLSKWEKIIKGIEL